jgi:hypothetical protein
VLVAALQQFAFEQQNGLGIPVGHGQSGNLRTGGKLSDLEVRGRPGRQTDGAPAFGPDPGRA